MPYSIVCYLSIVASEKSESLSRSFFHLFSPYARQGGILPYTLSPLFLAEEQKRKDTFQNPDEETLFRLRITWLDDERYPLFLKAVEEIPSKKEIFLGNRDSWVKSSSYQSLWDEAETNRREVSLQFFTSTVAPNGKELLPFPIPGAIFEGFLKAWQAFSSISLPLETDSLLNSIKIADFRISPQTFGGNWKESEFITGKGPVVGFSGWARFFLPMGNPEAFIKVFNLLSNFSFYCGTGICQDTGMGMTKRIA